MLKLNSFFPALRGGSAARRVGLLQTPVVGTHGYPGPHHRQEERVGYPTPPSQRRSSEHFSPIAERISHRQFVPPTPTLGRKPVDDLTLIQR